MALHRITKNIFYIDGSTNIGVIRVNDNNDVLLVDTGLNDSKGKRIIKLLDKNGFKIKYIINTHMHADHVGGNNIIQKRIEGVRIFSTRSELSVMENPIYMPYFLYCGANPINDLKNRFLLAKPSKITDIIEIGSTLNLENADINIVDLDGHAKFQKGIEFEGVLFCGDSLISEVLLQKHKIPVNVDIHNTIKTLEFIKNSDYDHYLPAHGDLMNHSEIQRVVQLNLDKIEEIQREILKYLATERTTENIVAHMLYFYDLKPENAILYYLCNSTIMAYLSYLESLDKVEFIIKGNLAFWALKG
jgi:glyoxylase-like metal-dependent hydrolase (beta-lactamase superfamily II)